MTKLTSDINLRDITAKVKASRRQKSTSNLMMTNTLSKQRTSGETLKLERQKHEFLMLGSKTSQKLDSGTLAKAPTRPRKLVKRLVSDRKLFISSDAKSEKPDDLDFGESRNLSSIHKKRHFTD